MSSSSVSPLPREQGLLGELWGPTNCCLEDIDYKASGHWAWVRLGGSTGKHHGYSANMAEAEISAFSVSNCCRESV